MGKKEILDYVMNTPRNTNRAVLGGMLDEISGTKLPSPTPSDDGKVLGVDGGEYKLIEQSGGSASSADDIDVLNIMSEYGFGTPISDSEGNIITDYNNNIILG